MVILRIWNMPLRRMEESARIPTDGLLRDMTDGEIKITANAP